MSSYDAIGALVRPNSLVSNDKVPKEMTELIRKANEKHGFQSAEFVEAVCVSIWNVREEVNELRDGIRALVNNLSIGFDELARLLDRAYTDGYNDRDKALCRFGLTYRKQLEALVSQE